MENTEPKEKEPNFGDRVEQLLKKNNVKPFDFYRGIGIVPQAFYDWKKKGQIPNARSALKIARYFGVTVEYLVTGETTNPLQAKVDELHERLQKIQAYVNEITKDA